MAPQRAPPRAARSKSGSAARRAPCRAPYRAPLGSPLRSPLRRDLERDLGPPHALPLQPHAAYLNADVPRPWRDELGIDLSGGSAGTLGAASEAAMSGRDSRNEMRLRKLVMLGETQEYEPLSRAAYYEAMRKNTEKK